MYRINVSFLQAENATERVKEIFGINSFTKINVTRGEKTVYNVSIIKDEELPSTDINKIITENDFISAIERCDD